MSATRETSSGFTLVLSEGERSQLLSILDQALRDTHAEARRTEAPDYRDRVHHQEAVLRGLLDKLRQT
jgi:hypothetical protein